MVENKKTRIAHIFNHSYFLGGGEISFFELIRKLDKGLFKPIVIVPAAGEIERKLQCNNIEVHLIPFPSLKSIIKLSPLKAVFNLCKFLREKRIDLIHANGSRVCLYGAIAGRIIKTPVIWHVRESLKDLLLYDWLLAILANAIICVSKSVQLKRFGRFGQSVNKKISIVYNGVDTSEFQESFERRDKVRTQFSLKPSEILIGLIGNIIPRKAQDFFLKGFAEAKQIQPDLSVKVILIGHYLDKQFGDHLRELVTDLDLQSDVIFHEFSDKIPNILSALDIFALSSKSEGFCRSLLEAMSCGLPIIATKISEIEEAIIDKKNGILVDFMDVETMASAIITLCKNDNMRKEIGIRNRSVVDKKFNLVSHAKAIESLHLSIIRGEMHNSC
jgi:glycosyltransferase involved in cell wall biosynthesis